MLRPPTNGGRGESDLHDFDDNEITPRRGRPDGFPDDQDQPVDAPGANWPSGDRPSGDRPSGDRPSGGPAMPGDPQSDLPQRLGDRLENGSSSSISPGEPDVLPDVEPPDTTM